MLVYDGPVLIPFLSGLISTPAVVDKRQLGEVLIPFLSGLFSTVTLFNFGKPFRCLNPLSIGSHFNHRPLQGYQ